MGRSSQHPAGVQHVQLAEDGQVALSHTPRHDGRGALGRAGGCIAPDNRDDLDDARLLIDQADKMLTKLAAANIAASDEQDDPTTLADNVLPVWAFPTATELPL
jgi:hypothetical protein